MRVAQTRTWHCKVPGPTARQGHLRMGSSP
jgi:hypothetical protein